jgi:hypothetical protein
MPRILLLPVVELVFVDPLTEQFSNELGISEVIERAHEDG